MDQQISEDVLNIEEGLDIFNTLAESYELRRRIQSSTNSTTNKYSAVMPLYQQLVSLEKRQLIYSDPENLNLISEAILKLENEIQTKSKLISKLKKIVKQNPNQNNNNNNNENNNEDELNHSSQNLFEDEEQEQQETQNTQTTTTTTTTNSNECPICKRSFVIDKAVQIDCVKCKRKYHVACAQIRTDQVSSTSNGYYCHVCRKNTPASEMAPNNPSMPFRFQKLTNNKAKNNNAAKKVITIENNDNNDNNNNNSNTTSTNSINTTSNTTTSTTNNNLTKSKTIVLANTTNSIFPTTKIKLDPDHELMMENEISALLSVESPSRFAGVGNKNNLPSSKSTKSKKLTQANEQQPSTAPPLEPIPSSSSPVTTTTTTTATTTITKTPSKTLQTIQKSGTEPLIEIEGSQQSAKTATTTTNKRRTISNEDSPALTPAASQSIIPNPPNPEPPITNTTNNTTNTTNSSTQSSKKRKRTSSNEESAVGSPVRRTRPHVDVSISLGNSLTVNYELVEKTMRDLHESGILAVTAKDIAEKLLKMETQNQTQTDTKSEFTLKQLDDAVRKFFTAIARDARKIFVRVGKKDNGVLMKEDALWTLGENLDRNKLRQWASKSRPGYNISIGNEDYD